MAITAIIPFTLTDQEAVEMMRSDCSLCGAVTNNEDGCGISRLRYWNDELLPMKEKAKKPFMGPFAPDNCIPACSVCNMMKGARRVRSFIEAAKHISTFRSSSDTNYGLFPKRFRNVS